MKKTSAIIGILAIAIFAMLAGCSVDGLDTQSKTGSVTLHVGTAEARTVQPVAAAIEIKKYSVSGAGPNGNTYPATEQTTGTFTLSKLALGEWTFTVSGKDVAGVEVASGTVAVTVVAATPATAAVTLAPLAGTGATGTFAMELTWPSTITVSSVTGVMTPETGTATTFTATIAGSKATYTNATLPVGSYKLKLYAVDSSNAVYNDVYALRIHKDLTSPLNLALLAKDFTTTGSANLTVTNPWNPTMTFAGNQSVISVGGSMTVTATVAPAPDSYAWYLDGNVIAGQTTNALTIGSAVAAGSHTVTLMVKKGTTLASSEFVFTATTVLPGTIAGTVKNAVTAAGIDAVTITVLSGTATVATTTSNSAGAYSLSVPSGVTYQVRFAKTGFYSDTFDGIAVDPSMTTTLETILKIADTYTGPGVVSGQIKDAFSGLGVTGITLSLRAGLGVKTGTIVYTGTTDSSGNYSISGVATGNYTAQISKTGYVTEYFSLLSIGGTTRANQNATITPVISASEIRFVLTWGAAPNDLDSHMLVPTSGTPTHIYYGNPGSKTTSPFAALDVDDTSSYGPETITVYSQQPGDYTYYVYNFTGSPDISTSGAQVKVYMGSSVRTFNVPAGTGRYWKVCRVNGTTLTPINTLETVAPAASASIDRGSDIVDESTMFLNMPAK